jgi:two-component system sensor histidine kinase CreC
MRIGLRILLGYFLIVGLAAWFLLNVFMEQVKPGVRSTLEDTLVDTSQLLANLVAPDLRAGTLATSPVLARMQDYARHGVDININGVRKRPRLPHLYYGPAWHRAVRFQRARRGARLFALERRVPDLAGQVWRAQHAQPARRRDVDRDARGRAHPRRQ